MRILGIDPGSRVTGYGVIDVDLKMHQGRDTIQSYGVIELDSKQNFHRRIFELGQCLNQILEKFRPQHVVIEGIFLGKNADSAFKLGHARGVCLYQAQLMDAQVFEYATRVVKKAVAGTGAATKEDVEMALRRMLGVGPLRPLDASDALAMAVYHGQQMRWNVALQQQNQRQDRGQL